MRMLAVHASWVIAPHLARGERVTPSRLLGEEIDARDLTPDEFDERVREMRDDESTDEDNDDEG
jgi:hypothetical protein